MPTTTYLWDTVSDNLLSEDDGTITTNYTNEPGQFGNLVSQNNSLTTNTNFYHFDARGDTRELTDDTEAVTDTRLYDVWGNVLSSTGTTPTLFQFVGKLGYTFDATLQMTAIRQRWYSKPRAGWMSLDPLGFNDGTNLYSYVSNNPVLLVDPSGTCSCCCCPDELSFGKIRVEELLDPNAVERFSFIFRVNAGMQMTEERVEPGGMCKIEWHECTDKGGSLGQKPGEWYRPPSPSDDPPGNVASDWGTPPPANCSGKFTRFWGDAPTALQTSGATVLIKFAVRVSAGENCLCNGKPEATLFFTMKIEVKKFNPNFPEKTEFEPNPPTLVEGLVDEMDTCTNVNVPWD